MKKYFYVSFKCSESVYCPNIAHAETAEAVADHYSKYEWVDIREAKAHEIETARQKGMPIVEIETPESVTEEKKENTVKEFSEIKKIVLEDAEQTAENRRFFILNGYMQTWAEEHRVESDRGLKDYSTSLRWNQYKSSYITREKAVNLAIKRALKAIEKDTSAKLARLDRIASAPDLKFISVAVDWVKSRTWGSNPHAEIVTNSGTFRGTASGCGYDKESAAIAEALNQCNSALKPLCVLKENGLKSGFSDKSDTCTGRSNHNICGYGSGYNAIPNFEGGVGSDCFWHIFKKCGFDVREHHTKNSDYYIIEKVVQK